MRTLSAILCAATGLAACAGDPAATTTATTATPDTTGHSATTASEDATDDSGDAGSSVTADAPTTTGGPAGACEGPAQTLVLARPNAMLVLDKSGAMRAQVWDHDGAPDTPEVSRWSSLRAVLDEVLADYEHRIDIGASLSPAAEATADYSAEACVVLPQVEVPVAPLSRGTILDAIPEHDASVQGSSPVAAALTVALEHLESLDPLERSALVLLAYRIPTCVAGGEDGHALHEVYDADAQAVVASAFSVAGVPVHVITFAVADVVYPPAKDGLPDGENPLVRWTEIASGGGAGPLVNATSEAQVADALRAALETVLVDEPGCVLPLTGALEEPDEAIVRVDGAELARVTDCAGEDGWRFVEPGPPYQAIELCGAACEQLQEVGEAEIVDCQDPIGAPPRPAAALDLRRGR